MKHHHSEPGGASTTTQSQVAQAPPLPKEVVKKPAYIPVTSKTSTKVLEADLGLVAGLKMHVNKAVMVAPYYQEVVVGRRVKIPSKCFKNKQIVISAEGKEADATMAPKPQLQHWLQR